MTTAIKLGGARITNPWEKFLERSEVPGQHEHYTTWFQPTRLNRAECETLLCRFPAQFSGSLDAHLRRNREGRLSRSRHPNIKVQYVCTEEEPVQAAPVVSGGKQAKLDFESSGPQLNTRYTFDSFCRRQSNEFAQPRRAPCRTAVESLQPAFPLWRRGMARRI